MLLSQAIATQQNLYAQVQLQIEQLQEQQRQIQAYLQRLGSIESKMESAAALMQEAIADINADCPDELPQYRDLITSLFISPVGLLTPETDNTPDDEPPTPPTSPKPETSDEWKDEPAVEATVEIVSEVVTTPESDVEEIMTAISELSWTDFKRIALGRGVPVVKRTKVAVTDDFRRLLEMADAQTLATIRGAITSLHQKKILTLKTA